MAIAKRIRYLSIFYSGRIYNSDWKMTEKFSQKSQPRFILLETTFIHGLYEFRQEVSKKMHSPMPWMVKMNAYVACEIPNAKFGRGLPRHGGLFSGFPGEYGNHLVPIRLRSSSLPQGQIFLENAQRLGQYPGLREDDANPDNT